MLITYPIISPYDTMQSNLSRSVCLMCTVVATAMVTTPYFALALSKFSDNSNSAKDSDFYIVNSHNLTALNDTGSLKDCSTTGQMGPCWDSPYETFVP
jgi:hypothetical protein